MSTITLRQATILDSGEERRADILISDGRIQAVGTVTPEGRTVDLDGLVVLPGIIDAHVHARDPGATHKEDFRSISEAALAGGVTAFLDMPNNNPPTISRDRLEEKRDAAGLQSLVNYGFFLGATPDNIQELNGIDNVAGIKVYLGSSTGDLLIDDLGTFARILAETTKLLVLHAENESLLRYFGDKYGPTGQHHQIRDNVAAATSVAEGALLSRRFCKRIHIAHTSSLEEMELLRAFKTDAITCEVCPHHLFLDCEYFKARGNRGKMNPPLREEASVKALWAGLQDGVVDIIATDHAPHTPEEKDSEYASAPCGVPGIETSLPLMLDANLGGRLSLWRLQDMMCAHPAEIFGIRSKGRIRKGFDADLCVLDRSSTTTFKNENQFTKCRWTPFDGMTVRGRVVMTLVGGEIKFEEGKVVSDSPGRELSFD